MADTPAGDDPGSAAGPVPVRPGRRIAELDALRGFALCGIVFINIPQTLEMFAYADELPAELRVFVLGRFYPIFFLLFGIGFGIFLRSARRHAARPRVLLLRRFVALGILGVPFHLLQPGEVLLPFAITGVLVLLPFSLLAGRELLLSGAVLTAVGVLAGTGGFAVLPGLLVLGFALAELEVPENLQRWTVRRLPVAGAGIAAIGLPAWWELASGLPGIRLGLVLSLSMSAGYLVLFLLVLRTPAGPAASWVLAPMGRMALTNYVTAAMLFVPIGGALGLRDTPQWGLAVLLGAGVLAIQAVFSNAWLRAFRYGPLEWAWRCVTYWRLLPIRARPPQRAPS
ncbi:DUF418 domain-containing protein [Actinomadura sp. 9N407]|uniref:DUF418 domain-containing protein n=1 Tax=Actinomadura sp. 9N407 TaxID=3375154 RepID=UPI00378D2A89